jgi:putative endonuclease
MGACVYILQSKTTGRSYVGSTVDLARRLEEHGRGHSPATRGRGPWRLVHTEPFCDLPSARRREYQIKSWKSRRLIQALFPPESPG